MQEYASVKLITVLLQDVQLSCATSSNPDPRSCHKYTVTVSPVLSETFILNALGTPHPSVLILILAVFNRGTDFRKNKDSLNNVSLLCPAFVEVIVTL